MNNPDVIDNVNDLKYDPVVGKRSEKDEEFYKCVNEWIDVWRFALLSNDDFRQYFFAAFHGQDKEIDRLNEKYPLIHDIFNDFGFQHLKQGYTSPPPINPLLVIDDPRYVPNSIAIEDEYVEADEFDTLFNNKLVIVVDNYSGKKSVIKAATNAVESYFYQVQRPTLRYTFLGRWKDRKQLQGVSKILEIYANYKYLKIENMAAEPADIARDIMSLGNKTEFGWNTYGLNKSLTDSGRKRSKIPVDKESYLKMTTRNIKRGKKIDASILQGRFPDY